MSTTNISSENPIIKEASSLLQKLSIFSHSQSQSQDQSSQVKATTENNEDEKEDENDSDYEIDEAEEEEANEQEEQDDKYLDDICNDNEPKQGLGSDEVIDINKELNEALDVVKNIALKHKEIIINKIKNNYQQDTGEEISSQNIQHAFKLLQMQINNEENVEDLDAKQEEEEEDDDDDDEEQDENIDASSEEDELDELQQDEYDELEQDDEEENEVSELDDNEVESLSPQDQEALDEDIEEAMQIASELGKQDREQLNQKYYETFVEINGQEPTQEQINNIFQRVQEQLREEAEEEIFDDCDDTFEDDNIDVASTLLLKLSNWSDEDKKELFEEAQTIIPQEIQEEVKEQWSKSCGRQPNEQEFQNIIITLAQTKFTDEFFSKTEVAKIDDDYDPEQDSQVDEQDDDFSSDQDEEDELESLKQEIGNKILQQTIQSFEKKFGRSPDFEEQLINIENLFGSEKLQQLCDDPVENANDDQGDDNNESNPVESNQN